jgi:hypothetical protein
MNHDRVTNRDCSTGLVVAPVEGCVVLQASTGSIAAFLADIARNGPRMVQPDPVASADQAQPGTWYLGPCVR